MAPQSAALLEQRAERATGVPATAALQVRGVGRAPFGGLSPMTGGGERLDRARRATCGRSDVANLAVTAREFIRVGPPAGAVSSAE